MIDCHTHLTKRQHMSNAFLADARRSWGPGSLPMIEEDQHLEAMASVDRAIVLGFRAAASGFVMPNELVSDYIARHPDKLIGFAGIDMAEEGAQEEVKRAAEDLGLKGIKIGPIYQDIDPLDRRALMVYAEAQARHLPVMLHQGTTFVRHAPLKWARPLIVDEVARRFPDLRIVIAHMGHPWFEECVVVVRKHPNVFADVSALHPRPWQLYNALRCALEYRISDKLLFGSDFPFFTPEETAEGLRRICDITKGTGLPPIPASFVEELIQRDGLKVLGLIP